ncbi:MAG: hypothetical protein NC349_06065 [Paenibacillus sp.]|nr:hypothetical protein [Paenibacillus sp.]
MSCHAHTGVGFYPPFILSMPSHPPVTTAEKRGLIFLLILLLLASAYLCRDHLFGREPSTQSSVSTPHGALPSDSLINAIPLPDPSSEQVNRKPRRKQQKSPSAVRSRQPSPAPRSPRDEPVN